MGNSKGSFRFGYPVFKIRCYLDYFSTRWTEIGLRVFCGQRTESVAPPLKRSKVARTVAQEGAQQTVQVTVVGVLVRFIGELYHGHEEQW